MIGIYSRLGRLAATSVCLLLFLAVLPGRPHAADPAAFVNNLATRAIPVLTDRAIPEAEREAEFRRIMNEGFDVDRIAQLVLGRYWRQASGEQQAEFVRLLQDYIVQMYAERFTEYANVSLQVDGVRAESEGTLVRSTLVRPSAAPVALDWRVEQENGRMFVTDLVVEGVSMVITQRSEFASVIRQGGGQVQALIDILRQRVRA